MVKRKAFVEKKECLACGGCISVCPEDALEWVANKAYVDEEKCIGCQICYKTCPVGAIAMVEEAIA